MGTFASDEAFAQAGTVDYLLLWRLRNSEKAKPALMTQSARKESCRKRLAWIQMNLSVLGVWVFRCNTKSNHRVSFTDQVAR